MDSTAYYVGAYYGSSGKHYLEDDGMEENGRQKRRSANSESEETEYRILCPGSKIGSVIGKGGSVIKSLRQECRSKIKVEDPVPGSDERVIYICSTSSKNRDQDSVCPAQEALFRVHGRIVDGSYEEDDDEPPQPVTARLLVPHSQIGCLIGKGGKIIEQMRKEIGAQIRILPKEQLPTCASADDELVQISGEPALVKKALKAISSRLHDSPPRERTEGGPLVSQGAGSMPLMPGGDGLYSSGSYLSQAGSLLAPTSLGGPMGSFGGYGLPSLGGYGGTGVGSAWSLSSGALLPSSVGAPGTKTHNESSAEDELSIRVLCPNARIGSMIGKGGNVIKKMREDTGAKIKVGDPVPDCDERVLQISAGEFIDGLVSPVLDATLQVFHRLVDLQMEKDKDIRSFTARLLVPSSNIGCLLGKGGSIISEMRKVTKANIRIPPKEELPKCAGDNDELVQIMGDQNVVQDALVHVINQLRNNLFKSRDNTFTGRFIAPLSAPAFAGAMLPTYGGRYDVGTYPLTNINLPSDYGFGGYGSALGGGNLQTSGGGSKKPRRK